MGDSFSLAVMHERIPCTAMIKCIADRVWPCGKVDHRGTKPAIKRPIKRRDTILAIGMNNRNAFSRPRPKTDKTLSQRLCGVFQFAPRKNLACFWKNDGHFAGRSPGLKPIAHSALRRNISFKDHRPTSFQ